MNLADTPTTGLYLVCKKYLGDIKTLLSEFFLEKETPYSHDGWITFTPDEGSGFAINLMAGKDQELSQGVIFEVYCTSYLELEAYAKKHNLQIQSFVVTEVSEPYEYSFIEIPGPANICSVEISYCNHKI